MAKKPAAGQKTLATVYTPRRAIHRRALFLPRLLAEQSSKAIYRGLQQDAAFKVLKKWAELDRDGHLQKKETSLNADFLMEIFSQISLIIGNGYGPYLKQLYLRGISSQRQPIDGVIDVAG